MSNQSSLTPLVLYEESIKLNTEGEQVASARVVANKVRMSL